MLKIFITWFFIFNGLYIPIAFSQKNKSTVIINNKASSSSTTQNISAPALVPSEAKKLRDVREKQEISTESAILKELEKQRLLDEQKRADKILGKTSSHKEVGSTPVSKKSNFYQGGKMNMFGNKPFISVGAGVVAYPGVDNINSTDFPAFFASFGAYGYERLIFDLAFYYSKQYLTTFNKNYTDLREVVHQPALSMSLKFSPSRGPFKPYFGVSGSLVARKWGFVHRSGEVIDKHHDVYKDVGVKTWYGSFDAGLAMGGDLALGAKLGLNVDLRYYWNVYTENRKTLSQYLTSEDILDEQNSLILSVKLIYYL